MMTYTQAVEANEAASGSKSGAYPSGFTDFLSMKALARKRLEMFGNPTGANANALAFAARKELTRNLCVRTDVIRLAELDALIEVLSCSKQELVMELLVAGMEQAKEAVELAGLKHVYDVSVDRRIAEAGFTVEPAATEGYWKLHYHGEALDNKDHDRHIKASTALMDLVEQDLSNAAD